MTNLQCTSIIICMLFCATRAYGTDVKALVEKLNSTVEAERKAATTELLDGGRGIRSQLVELEGDVYLSRDAVKALHGIIAESTFSECPLKTIDTGAFATIKSPTSQEPVLYYNKDARIIAIPAEFKIEVGPLEYIAVINKPNAPMHETVVAVKARASDICLALLACEYASTDLKDNNDDIDFPKNAGVMISVQWEKEDKSQKRVPVECFVHNKATGRNMRRVPFAFTGSFFVQRPSAQKQMALAADLDGTVAALMFNNGAIMNTALNTRTINPRHDAGYEVNRFTIPERGTKCLLILEPWTGDKLTQKDLDDKTTQEQDTK